MFWHRLLCVAGVLFSPALSFSQVPQPFDLPGYESFLAAHQDLSSRDLLQLYPAGSFKREAPVNPDLAQSFRAIDSSYSLTAYERLLLTRNGFVTTDRLRYLSFGQAVADIYKRDLPVFVSTDAILHAVHASYDAILKDAETGKLMPTLDSLLVMLRSQVPALQAAYASEPALAPMVRDLDVYLTVAQALLKGSASPSFTENSGTVQTLLALIDAQAPGSYPLFSSTNRIVDFSQFTVRGHYTESAALGRYFRAMIWLGRTEMYLLPPTGVLSSQKPGDIRRQTIDAALLVEASERAGAFPTLESIDAILRLCVGESDNVTLPNMKDLLERSAITTASQLLDSSTFARLQDTLKSQPFAFQRINSQILISNDIGKPGTIQPASSVLMLGQRFVVDSYVTGNVVFDKISYQGAAIWRPLPSTLDVLFALGNDAAAQLLQGELDTYHYGTNLAALRYLIDGYDPSFWTGSLFNAWLNMIRACNPPADRTPLPSFMTTAAWWQEKMNTQLASWAELRHDNLLYAKQSYTGGSRCSFPAAYVEPIPAFFDAMRSFADLGRQGLATLPNGGSQSQYFSFLGNVADTLGGIARKELSGSPFTAEELRFLRSMYSTSLKGCVIGPDGWYFHLFYNSGGFSKQDFVVADVHTCPTDAAGTMVGWVLHAGTGPIDMAIVTPTVDGCGSTAYIGPVSSYHEQVSTNFKRYTDDEWSTSYALSPASRPAFVNLYLADSAGSSRGFATSLLTTVQEDRSAMVPQTLALHQNYPNPFNPSTMITYTIPSSGRPLETRLRVYDLRGSEVRMLLSGVLPGGNYATRWDGRNNAGQPVASGMYVCRLASGGSVVSMKMLFLK